ncbi:MAG: AI-2E family transporter [Eubacteriales bacterium]|nr:AI-2E family transporter [Eubacteriales bacterium]
MKRALRVILTLAGITALVWCTYRLRGLLYAVLAAVAFAYLAARPFRCLQQRMAKNWALLLIFGCAAAGGAAVCVLIVPVLAGQVGELAGMLPEAAERLRAALDGVSAAFPFVPIAAMEQTLSGWITRFAMETAQKSYSAAAWIVVTPILAFYFLRDQKMFLSALGYLLPVRMRQETQTLWRRIDRSLRQFLRGQLIVSALVGALTAAGLALCGVPYAALLGVIVGVCNLIPYIGPVLGALPVAAVSLLSGWKLLLAAMAVVVGVQQLENLLISPRIIGGSIRMHPAYVLLGVLGGGTLLGPVGFLAAVPLLVVAKETATFLLEKRLYPTA